jgi:hypothetical protein
MAGAAKRRNAVKTAGRKGLFGGLAKPYIRV